MFLLSLSFYSLLYSTLVNSLLLIITNQSDIFDLTCCNLSGGFFFSSGDIRCAWLRTGERYVCAICDGMFRIRVIGTVLYYQSKWIPTSERRCTYIHCTFLYFFTSTVVVAVVAVAVAAVLRLEWMTRLDWIGFSYLFLGTCRTLVWTSLLLLLFIAPPLAGVGNTLQFNSHSNGVSG